VRKAPTGPKWIHEIKYDGYRMQARIDGRTIRLLTRKKLDWTNAFAVLPTHCRHLSRLGADRRGDRRRGCKRDFELQQPAGDLKAGRLDRFRYFVFDIFYCEGFDLTKAVLKDVKNCCSNSSPACRPGHPFASASISKWTGQPCWNIRAGSDSKGSFPNG